MQSLYLDFQFNFALMISANSSSWLHHLLKPIFAYFIVVLISFKQTITLRQHIINQCEYFLQKCIICPVHTTMHLMWFNNEHCVKSILNVKLPSLHIRSLLSFNALFSYVYCTNCCQMFMGGAAFSNLTKSRNVSNTYLWRHFFICFGSQNS